MKRSSTFWLLPVLFYFVLNHVRAQSSDQYADARADSSRAYWTLRAGYTDQTPVVQFYNAHHQLLYQEPLPPTVRRVNRQTKRTLDVLLASLVQQRVLATTYWGEKAEATEPALFTNASTSKQGHKQVVFRKGVAVVSADPLLSSSGKLIIQCSQLQDRLMRVTLEDADQNSFFEEYRKTTHYTRKLNLTRLPSGLYYLKIGRASHPFTYRLLVDQPAQHFELQNPDEQLAKQ